MYGTSASGQKSYSSFGKCIFKVRKDGQVKPITFFCRIYIIVVCQAQPKLQVKLSLKAEFALMSISSSCGVALVGFIQLPSKFKKQTSLE
jgi:hypothetical protein